MVALPTPPNADEAAAKGISGDGSIVAGYGLVGPNEEALRWTSAGYTVLPLLPGGTTAYANGISTDGSTIVGASDQSATFRAHAVAWTSSGITDLGVLPGFVLSAAEAANRDGSVIVGESADGNFTQHAFRWTHNGGMSDLGTLGGSNSVATAVDADGNVVVGSSDGPGFGGHAYRWTTTGGMVDLGTLAGGDGSEALGVSASGNIVVGASFNSGQGVERAFRWTSQSGMRNLNTLLTDAGVNMAGIVLEYASAISANGQFIAGNATFSGANRGFLVRYDDGTDDAGSPPSAGLTTVGALQQSVNQLASAITGVIAQQHGLAAPLLSDDKPVTGHSQIGAFGYGGSASGGGFAQWADDSGLAILAGVSYAQEDIDSAEMTDNVMAAGALRYVMPTGHVWRPFVEGGGWIAPNADLAFDRTYANGAGTATGSGATQGDLSYLFGRAGMLFDFGARNQLSFSGEIGKERLDAGGYSETYSRSNPFNATVGAAKDQLDIAKVRLIYNFAVTEKVDAALWAAGDFAVDRYVDVTAAIPGAGVFSSTNDGGLAWAEFGGRVGYALTNSVTLDVFCNGVAGNAAAIDTSVHTGADLRYQF